MQVRSLPRVLCFLSQGRVVVTQQAIKQNLTRDSLMVRYWAHNPGTDNACASSTLAPAIKL